MVTNKKRRWRQLQFVLMAATMVCLGGCKPAGPRALLSGKRLIEEKKYTEAVGELKRATTLLSTNAQAWNYLGLAYHRVGELAEAIDAYQRALKLNEDLIVAHYNLGCALLEQNTPDTLESAQNEFTAYTLHQRNSENGWVKLGAVQLRRGELAPADASFREALRVNIENVEAMNDLGVVLLQRKRWRDATLCFNNALKLQPNYGPALLNLAIASTYQGNRGLALEKYKGYLQASPHDEKWDAVNTIATQLDQELNPPARPVVVNPPTNAAPVVMNPVTNTPPRVETVTNTPKPLPPPVTPVKAAPVEIPPTTEVVKVTEAPPIRVAENITPSANETAKTSAADTGIIGTPPPEVAPNATPEKRGFFQKLNPMSLFHRDSKVTTNRSATVAMTSTSSPSNKLLVAPIRPADTVTSTPTTPTVVSVPRYPYLDAFTPTAGNRSDAERLAGQGSAAQRDHRTKDAVGFYRAATQKDATYFEAYTGLGAAATEAGDLPEACRAYEMAVAVKPDSFDARFNFGLALKRANYIVDSAQEFERLLATSSARETPAHLALVHLTLGNLYAEQFNQPASARPHYRKVLDLDPANSQATAIRYWLQSNP